MYPILDEMIKELSFCRNAGTPQEKKAFNYIKQKLDLMNIPNQFQPFMVNSYEPWNSSVKYGETRFELFPLGLTGNTPTDGISAPFEYIYHAPDAMITESLEGKIALTYGSISVEKYQSLKNMGCVGYLRIINPNSDLMHINVASECIEKYGELPGAIMLFEDAKKLIEDNPEKITINIFQKTFSAETNNLVAEIKGTRYEDEIVVIGAHLDTVPEISGVQDNLSGCSALLEIADRLNKNKPIRTVRIVWFSGEELGMYGSRHYVNKCNDHIEKHKIMINLDAFGGKIGKPKIRVMGPENLLTYAKIIDSVFGDEFNIEKSLYTSDNIVFYANKIPTISFGQQNGTSDLMHTLHDKAGILNEFSINRTMKYVLRVIEDTVYAQKIPFKHEEDKALMDETKDYFKKWLGTEELEHCTKSIRKKENC